MTNPIYGRCLCGAVEYEILCKPVFSANCHCRDCQRSSGGAYAPVMLVKKDMVKIQGEIKFHDVKADSGLVNSRGFCPECGSQLFEKLESMPHFVTIKAGTLDQPELFEPKLDFYTSSAQPWDFMNPDLPKARREPELS